MRSSPVISGVTAFACRKSVPSDSYPSKRLTAESRLYCNKALQRQFERQNRAIRIFPNAKVACIFRGFGRKKLLVTVS
jgi:hypothetical protein